MQDILKHYIEHDMLRPKDKQTPFCFLLLEQIFIVNRRPCIQVIEFLEEFNQLHKGGHQVPYTKLTEFIEVTAAKGVIKQMLKLLIENYAQNNAPTKKQKNDWMEVGSTFFEFVVSSQENTEYSDNIRDSFVRAFTLILKENAIQSISY